MSAHEQKPVVFEHEHPAPPTPGGSSVIFLVMAGLTATALLIGFVELGAIKVWASLAVAVVQTAVVVLFSMELRHSDTLTKLTAAAAAFWTLILFVFTLTDYLTRHYYAY